MTQPTVKEDRVATVAADENVDQ